VLSRTSSAFKKAVLLDYDGTLAPLTENPADAFLPDAAAALLDHLLNDPALHCAIVSGRSVDALRGFLAPFEGRPLLLCGLHGGEVVDFKTGDAILSPDNALRTRVAAFKADVLALLDPPPAGLVLEDKHVSLAVHYRQVAPVERDNVVRAAQAAAVSYQDAFRLQPGKEVIELLPRLFNKGTCIDFLHQRWRQQHHGVVLDLYYAGDDLTDEAAFQAVNALNGWSVRVGAPHETTYAQQQVEGFPQLRVTLEAFLARQPGVAHLIPQQPAAR
jgi:trehalose 6-phosphate phosphatase